MFGRSGSAGPARSCPVRLGPAGFFQKFGTSFINPIKTMQIPVKTMPETLKMSGASRCLNIIKIAWIGCAFMPFSLGFPRISYKIHIQRQALKGSPFKTYKNQ